MKDIAINNEAFLTPKQLEQEFGISISHQYKLRMRKYRETNKGIPFVKIGKVILYKRESIDEWINSKELKNQQKKA